MRGTATTLDLLSEDERYDRFASLQRRMPEVWDLFGRHEPGESVVVVPSVSLDRIDERAGTLTQAYEERYLFLLLLLRQPRLQLIYVTSLPIDPAIIEYYLALLPGVIPSHARRRLRLVHVGDASPRPLTDKLLARPRLLARLRALVPDLSRSHLVPYNTTERERDLALSLGIPMYGADPRLFRLGTKSGCRRLFEQEGVAHPLGFEDVADLDQVLDALVALRSRRPGVTGALVKLDEGVSGEGNALVDLNDLPEPGAPHERDALARRVASMTFELPSVTLESFVGKLAERHGVVEERIVGSEVRSPSVQLRVLPSGEVELLSTHDQLLGGPSGQSYLGCRFPADVDYAAAISRPALVVGRRLAREGVLGRFALDFVVVRDQAGAWVPYAIEINLRKGGTTHPFLTLQYLTDGRYDSSSEQFVTPSGQPKYLVATDHLEAPALAGLSVEDVFDVVARHGMHFDQSRQAGVVLHMISSVTELGRLGLTAIGDTPADADSRYRFAQDVLLEEARASLTPLPLD